MGFKLTTYVVIGNDCTGKIQLPYDHDGSSSVKMKGNYVPQSLSVTPISATKVVTEILNT
jgi:hypothetical protein